jgi:hypothetical protein
MSRIASAFDKHVYSNDENFVVHDRGDTEDIISVIMYADKQSAPYTSKVAPLFMGNDLESTCRNIFDFLKENIRYVKDPRGHEQIKSPGRLWELKEGDCKSFSIFIGSILQNLGIPYVYRFVAFSRSPQADFTHVYVVADPHGQEIILDAVTDSFDHEEPYTRSEDWNPETGGPIQAVSGISGAFKWPNWKTGLIWIGIAAGCFYLVSQYEEG